MTDIAFHYFYSNTNSFSLLVANKVLFSFVFLFLTLFAYNLLILSTEFSNRTIVLGLWMMLRGWALMWFNYDELLSLPNS